MSKSEQSHPGDKWITGISPERSWYDAAHLILESRISDVSYWLPLAAEKSHEDVEYVHQLRVSTRRAVEAVRVFSDLIPEPARQFLRGKLRQVRQAADQARNLDVLCAGFARCSGKSCEESFEQIAEGIRQKRTNAQQPILSVHGDFVAGEFNERFTAILAEIRSAGKGKSKPTFERQARRCLKPVLKKFFKQSKADLASDEQLHRLRIRTKKLRYTMEIVEVAFERRFRKRLYPRISALQDVMGMVNDHATAKSVFSEWLSKTEEPQLQAFFRGVLMSEEKAHQDIRRAFFEIWTPDTVKELKKQFRDICGSF